MATKKTVKETEVIETATPEVETKAEAPKAEEKVEIFIERAGANEDPNFYVSVNGKPYLLPRGKTSLVPKCVYKEIMRSRKAQARLDETTDRLIELSKQPTQTL